MSANPGDCLSSQKASSCMSQKGVVFAVSGCTCRRSKTQPFPTGSWLTGEQKWRKPPNSAHGDAGDFSRMFFFARLYVRAAVVSGGLENH